MKILVVQLLRLGDIVLSTPVLTGLREKYPSAEIDLLINSQFANCRPLLPAIDRIIEFDRENIQSSLGTSKRSLFESYDRLNQLIQSLRTSKYDLVVNLTQNRLSGWLTSLVTNRESIGMEFSHLGNAHFGSPWLKYLNDVESDDKCLFHLSDILQFSAGLTALKKITLEETEVGSKATEIYLNGLSNFYVVQAFTSEEKKNWPLEKWASAIEQIFGMNPRLVPIIISSPQETKKLKSLVHRLSANKIPHRLKECSLDTAFSILKRSRFLLTGDTAIKHMAGAANIPVIEISIGSSHSSFTGVYQDGGVVIQSREHCAPCPHSSPCHRDTHACAARISAELVSSVAKAIWEQNGLALRTIAHEFSDEARIYQTDLNSYGHWTLRPLNQSFNEDALVQIVDRLSFKLHLQKEWDEHVGSIGHETQKIISAILKDHIRVATQEGTEECVESLDFMERRLERFQARLDVLYNDWKCIAPQLHDPSLIVQFRESLDRLSEEAKKEGQLLSFAQTLERLPRPESTDQFSYLRRVVGCLDEVKKRAQIESKIIRTMRHSFLEVT